MSILYHYTNLEGFMGIISHSKEEMGLWMSSSDYMNDKQERIYCVQVLAKSVEAIENVLGEEKVFTPLFKQLALSEPWKILRYFNQHVSPLNNLLMLSLSKSRDYLPLWGRYADRGNGVAIGLDEELLKTALNEKNIICSDVYYTDGDRIDSGIFFNYLRPKIEEGIRNFKDQGIDPNKTVHEIINGLGAIIKNPHFSYEQEVRVCQYQNKHNSEFKFRHSNNGIIPYQILKLNKNIIKEIIAGPSEEPYLFKNSLIDFYFNQGGSGCSDMFKSSDTPFRR